MKYYIYTTLGFLIVSLGCALNIQANVGLGAWDAFANAISQIIGLKIGTIGIIFNCACVFLQKIILKDLFTWKHFLQIPFSILLGTCINILTYYFTLIPETNLQIRCIYSFISYIIAAFGIAIVLLSNKVSFALEGACLAYADIYQKSFTKTRQSVDIICIIVITLLTFLFKIPYTIGLGTIIGAITFSPILSIFINTFTINIKKTQ